MLQFILRAKLDRAADAYDGTLVVSKGLKSVKIELIGSIPRSWLYGRKRIPVVVDLEPRLEGNREMIRFTLTEAGNMSAEAPTASGSRIWEDFRNMLQRERHSGLRIAA